MQQQKKTVYIKSVEAENLICSLFKNCGLLAWARQIKLSEQTENERDFLNLFLEFKSLE